MKDYIIHIPHSSLVLPDEFWDGVLLDETEIGKENKFLCDELVDTFVPKEFEDKIVMFQFSRMFIDVERFRSDDIESMSKLGMGAVYLKNSNGQFFRRYDENYREKILSEYYDSHHRLLESRTDEILSNCDICQIIDLHSFSDELVYKLFGKENNPDICIGVEENFNDPILLDYTLNYFNSLGYTTCINYPYEGSLVPTKHFYSKDPRVKSIMIEINKRVYLNDSVKYLEFQKVMNSYFNSVLRLKK